jgi:uncharacterized membrane protein
MLYRSTDRLRRRGASMKNLAHSASFHSTEKIAPSKAGIKQFRSHRAAMISLYVSLVAAGLFTLLPSRLIGHAVFGG